MSEFKKGQLVAVYDDDCSKKLLWIYDHASPEGLHFCRSPNRMIGPRWWRYAVPAEEIWSDIFLACDRGTIESRNQAIGWLCEHLEEASRKHRFCPPNVWPGDCDNACWECWRQAVYEAMEGKTCPQ